MNRHKPPVIIEATLVVISARRGEMVLLTAKVGGNLA